MTEKQTYYVVPTPDAGIDPTKSCGPVKVVRSKEVTTYEYEDTK
jgi:hypothetical protein